MRGLEPFLAPSIAFETSQELIPNENLQFRTKQGGLIADMKNDPDWFSSIISHIQKSNSNNY